MESKLTDAELVEAVAREVMGFERIGWAPFAYYAYGQGLFNPLTDANNLQLVKDKLREMGYDIEIFIPEKGDAEVMLIGQFDRFKGIADTEARAICEAALTAGRSEK